MTPGTSLHSKGRADHAADERYSGQRRGGRRPSRFRSVLVTRWRLPVRGVGVDLDPQIVALSHARVSRL